MHFFKFNQLTSYNIIYKIIIPFYILCITILHILYFIHYFKIFDINPIYVSYFNIFIEIFICLFLVIKFFPYTDHTFYKQDSIIIFACAVFLLFHIGFGNFMDLQLFGEKWRPEGV